MRHSGSRNSWESVLTGLVREHGRLFFRLACRIVGQASLAEEVCQQALLKTWERREEIADPPTLRSWVARVVVNESLQLARRLRIERRGLARSWGKEQGESAPGQQAEARESVMAAMEKLPETMRVIVSLRVMQGMSGNEVKELLGCSAAEVSRQLHAGMERLRGLLAEWDAESGGRETVAGADDGR